MNLAWYLAAGAVALFLTILIILSLLMEPGSGPGPAVPAEKRCARDADCACGVHSTTGECFYGNRAYVNEAEQCPDFCTGIAGNLRIRCIKGACTQTKETP